MLVLLSLVVQLSMIKLAVPFFAQPCYYTTSLPPCQGVFQKFFQLFSKPLLAAACGQLAYYSTTGKVCQAFFCKFFHFGGHSNMSQECRCVFCAIYTIASKSPLDKSRLLAINDLFYSFKKLIHATIQTFGKPRQEQDIGITKFMFPFIHCLWRYAHQFSKFILREPITSAMLFDFVSDNNSIYMRFYHPPLCQN